jgi:hypothetical protein
VKHVPEAREKFDDVIAWTQASVMSGAGVMGGIIGVGKKAQVTSAAFWLLVFCGALFAVVVANVVWFSGTRLLLPRLLSGGRLRRALESNSAAATFFHLAAVFGLLAAGGGVGVAAARAALSLLR